MIGGFQGKMPSVSELAYVAPSAAVIGDVTLADHVGVFFGAVLRGDEAPIHVGKNSNIQDNAVVHCDRDIPVRIGEYVTVGHSAIIHSCEVQDAALIGMGAIILNRAVIGEGSIIAAGSVVKEGEIVPPYTLYAGSPAIFKKQLDPQRRSLIEDNAREYIRLAATYKEAEG
jgi:carbonic anhydrase/acetyltransferase-like protein (isoleucine patch superfamily)